MKSNKIATMNNGNISCWMTTKEGSIALIREVISKNLGRGEDFSYKPHRSRVNESIHCL